MLYNIKQRIDILASFVEFILIEKLKYFVKNLTGSMFYLIHSFYAPWLISVTLVFLFEVDYKSLISKYDYRQNPLKKLQFEPFFV